MADQTKRRAANIDWSVVQFALDLVIDKYDDAARSGVDMETLRKRFRAATERPHAILAARAVVRHANDAQKAIKAMCDAMADAEEAKTRKSKADITRTIRRELADIRKRK